MIKKKIIDFIPSIFLMMLFSLIGFAIAGTGDPLYDGKAAQTITGKQQYYNVNANTGVTLSGATVFGGSAITGVTNAARAITSGVSMFLESATGGESFFVYVPDTTATSGNTINVIPKNGDTVNSNIACTAGASKFVLSGTVLSKKLIFWSTGTSTWYVDAVGTPTVEAD